MEQQISGQKIWNYHIKWRKIISALKLDSHQKAA